MAKSSSVLSLVGNFGEWVHVGMYLRAWINTRIGVEAEFPEFLGQENLTNTGEGLLPKHRTMLRDGLLKYGSSTDSSGEADEKQIPALPLLSL